jgi:hypothetical protein
MFPHDRTKSENLVMVCTLSVNELACGVQRTKKATGGASSNTCKDCEEDAEEYAEDGTLARG